MKTMREIPVFYKIKATSKFCERIEGYEGFSEEDYLYGVILVEYPSNTKDLDMYMKKIIPLTIVKDEKYLQDITIISEKEFIEARNN